MIAVRTCAQMLNVAPMNNVAERALRAVVINRKLNSGARSQRGGRYHS